MIYSDQNAEWLNTVAHDLKTPINSVRGCIEMVQQLGPLNEKQEQFAERALTGLKRMEHLVARLLDISWVDAGRPLDLEEVDLRAVIEEAVDLLQEAASQRSITIDVVCDERIGTLRADARRLGQVMDNLLSNAIKYNRDAGSIFISVISRSDTVQVSVQDTGIGISREDQEHIFERFFRARQGVSMRIEGSGLGLAITQGVINKHRGRIWFESELGKGTTFTFTLPLTSVSPDGRDSFMEHDVEYSKEPYDRAARIADLASEESDAVNDDMQEQQNTPQVDTSDDND
ncbi:MAG: HAMP domain-containing histidine kinase [Anaerolineae bacterium]|nr:HAMP domain-containing histidine kinase [Anaerolineae bacterium]